LACAASFLAASSCTATACARSSSVARLRTSFWALVSSLFRLLFWLVSALRSCGGGGGAGHREQGESQ
jgi:hypothetical protein